MAPFHSLLATLTTALLGLLLTPASTDAADAVFKFGKPTFFGSGCPEGSIEVVPSPDGQSVSMLFSQFAAKTSGAQLRDRQSCNLAVPVRLLPGVSIGVYRVDYRGYTYVPRGGTPGSTYTDFQASYFFSGLTGPTYKKTWTGGTDQDIVLTNKVGVSAIVWSPCATATTFRINAAITAAKPNAKAADPEIAIDTTDVAVASGLRYFLTYRPCTTTTK